MGHLFVILDDACVLFLYDVVVVDASISCFFYCKNYLKGLKTIMSICISLELVMQRDGGSGT